MDKIYRNGFLLILLSIGAVWLRSSMGKITGGKFVATLAPTLNKFSSDNPNVSYKDFLEHTIIPNSTVFGNLIMWGEFLIAIAITFSCLHLLLKKDKKIIQKILFSGLIGGALLNLNFWLASGWTSPSTDSLNLLMLIIELIGIIILVKTFKE